MIKDEKIVKNQGGGLKIPGLLWPLAMSCLDAKTSLVPKNRLIVPSTLLAHATDIWTHKATKPRGHSKKKKKIYIYIYISM